MRPRYEQFTESRDVFRRVAELHVRTIVFDVEPLVAFWDTDQAALERGVTATLDEVAALGLDAVVFATNSARELPVVPALTGAHVRYLAAARKPLRVSPYRDLPRPGAIVGDQVATDGVLARRLGYSFLHYCPDRGTTPRGPQLMGVLGGPVRVLLYSRKRQAGR